MLFPSGINFVRKKMDFLNVPITSVMTSEVVTVKPSQKLVDIKHIFEKRNFHNHIPVAEDGKLKGMISLIDFLYAIKNASLDDNENVYYQVLARDIMRERPVTISSNSTLRDVSEVLAKGVVHAIVVCDEGYIKGIISTADVIRYFLNMSKAGT
jgi:acetoin utilization protein AcuB